MMRMARVYWDAVGAESSITLGCMAMSKAFGVVGGVVAGKQIIVDWLRQRGRPFLFSSAMTVPDVAACLAGVDLLERSTEQVDRLWSNAEFFKGRMKAMGFDTGHTQT